MPDKILMPLPNSSSSGNNSNAQSLPPSIRHAFETKMGQDLSAVRIHEGHQATLMGAKAYAQGTDIYFAPNQYQPYTEAGNHLIGHELTHIVQQRGNSNIEVPQGMVEVEKTTISSE